MKKILIIDDDVDMCSLLKLFLTRKGYDVTEKYTGKEALDFLEYSQPDLIISDLMLGDIDGIELLNKVKQNNKSLPFIIITAYDDIEMSLKAIGQGAFNYVIKPIFPEEILMHVNQALAKKDINMTYNNFVYAKPVDYIPGETEAAKRINNQVNLIAPTDHNIIIYGETGAGKKTIGREIHRQSRRAAMPFVEVNCVTISKEITDIATLMEAANGGTLFLDNVTALSIDAQYFLLDALQQRRFKINEDRVIELNIRAIASSDEILWNTMVAGRFSEKFFQYLNGFNIEIFSLRNRKEDIMIFAEHFLQLANQKSEKNISGFTPDAVAVLKNYSWPGNLHELNNIITKAVLLNKDDGQITPALFPDEIKQVTKILPADKKEMYSGNAAQHWN